jgi:Integrase core domain
MDFLAVPTIRFQILYVFLVLAHERRRIVHFAVTARPTAQWTAQQLRESFPWDTGPRYLLRDRHRIFGKDFVDQVKAIGIKQVLSAPLSPWQRAYVEGVIGTIRRECLDPMIVFGEGNLYRHLQNFINYYHRSRTHLALREGQPGAPAGPTARRWTDHRDSGGGDGARTGFSTGLPGRDHQRSRGPCGFCLRNAADCVRIEFPRTTMPGARQAGDWSPSPGRQRAPVHRICTFD